MSEDPLVLSTRLIDSGSVDTAPNRITQQLTEIADGVALVESFSHVVAVDSGDGLIVFDTSSAPTGDAVVTALRAWSDAPVHSIIYTHGHLDHVGGSRSFAADAQRTNAEPPRVIGHENLDARFDRYEHTAGYNQVINRRQFGGAAVGAGPQDRPFLPSRTLRPDTTYRQQLTETVGDLTLELNHCKGETDDHTWTWIPEHRMISAGDQFIWNFPNCGNPQKVQRYPAEWAASLRDMAAKEAELFVPAHGLPIVGRERIARCLITVAETLEQLVSAVVAGMNAGVTLDEIIHGVTVPEETLALPYLRPLYDEPEFVVRNIWRLYGGWHDGNPARLKPPSDRQLAIEVAALAGGVDVLIERALALSASGEHRLACQLIEYAAAAEPESHPVHEARVTVYRSRIGSETSLMSKGIFKSAAAESTAVLTGETPEFTMVLELGN